MDEQKQPLIILTGPTAVGKTALSIRLAKEIDGEIISADSMQVYRHMDIGSAKIMQEEMQGIPHHLINILEPSEDFNVVIFQRLVKECLSGIYERGHIPILTGGTGFYIQAVLYGIDFTENEENSSFRMKLENIASEKGSEYLHEMLREIDPSAALSIHAHNVKRVIRALEFYQLTGKRISEHNKEERQKDAAYRSCYFVLNDSRETLYKRIDKRVDSMMENGLLEEVQGLKETGCNADMVSMQGLGYKEILHFLDGETSLERAVYLIKRDTRHFAKRQLTWFKRERDVIWIYKDQFQYSDDEILKFMLTQIIQKGLIIK